MSIERGPGQGDSTPPSAEQEMTDFYDRSLNIRIDGKNELERIQTTKRDPKESQNLTKELRKSIEARLDDPIMYGELGEKGKRLKKLALEEIFGRR